MATLRVLRTVALAAIVPLALAACSEEKTTSADAPDKPASSAAPAAADSSAPAASESAGGDLGGVSNADPGSAPDWAAGDPTVGTKIGSFKTASWKVDVFQVGTGKTESDSMFIDPDTKQNVLPKGSTVVFVNFAITNTSPAPITLGASLATPELTAADWQYMTGQPGASHSDEYEALKVSDTGHQVSAMDPYIVQPGQVFSQATSIKYVAGQKAEAKVTLIPVDANNELVEDKKEEGKTTVTIK